MATECLTKKLVYKTGLTQKVKGVTGIMDVNRNTEGYKKETGKQEFGEDNAMLRCPS